jgi:hypothetical protein
MKITLLVSALLLFISYTIYSQSLSLSNSQGSIPNNSTVTPHGTAGDDEIVAYAYVTNNSSASIPVMVKKVEIYITEGTTNTFCWGLCYPPNIYVSEEAVTIAPGSTNFNDFSGHLAPNGISGYDIVRYVFYNENNPVDSICMSVHFAHFPVAVETAEPTPFLSAAYPNPVTSTFSLDYHLPRNLEGDVILRNLAGVVVLQQSVSDPAGKVTFHIGNLADGVYVYSLVVSGKPARTGKVIIQHETK